MQAPSDTGRSEFDQSFKNYFTTEQDNILKHNASVKIKTLDDFLHILR